MVLEERFLFQNFQAIKYHAKNKTKVVGIRPGEKIHELMINNSEISRTYNFKNLYVISSSIQIFQNKVKPLYIRSGKPLSEKNMSEYSSENSIITKKEISVIFKKLGLL